MITAVDHVQLAAPAGSEDALRAYYAGALGMTEIPKPPALAARGGCWFAHGPVQLHLGVEDGFRPARKAHPGLRVTGIEAFARRLAEHGAPVDWDENLPGHRTRTLAESFRCRPFLAFGGRRSPHRTGPTSPPPMAPRSPSRRGGPTRTRRPRRWAFCGRPRPRR